MADFIVAQNNAWAREGLEIQEGGRTYYLQAGFKKGRAGFYKLEQDTTGYGSTYTLGQAPKFAAGVVAPTKIAPPTTVPAEEIFFDERPASSAPASAVPTQTPPIAQTQAPVIDNIIPIPVVKVDPVVVAQTASQPITIAPSEKPALDMTDTPDFLPELSREISGAIGLDPNRTLSSQIGQEAASGSYVAQAADYVTRGHFSESYQYELSKNRLPRVPACYARTIAREIKRGRIKCQYRI